MGNKKPEEHTTKARCDECGGGETLHTIRGSCVRNYPEPDGSPGFHADYLLVQCRGCNSVRMLEYEDYGGDPDILPTIFPTPKRRNPTAHREDYPDKVRAAYEDAVSALNYNLGSLCSVGIRMLIEGACRERKAANIDALVGLGLLAQKQADFLNILRHAGNKTAHGRIAPSLDAQDQALEIIEALLDTLYRLPRVVDTLTKGGPDPDSEEPDESLSVQA